VIGFEICHSQNVVVNPAQQYSPKMQRLLIKMVGTYLYNIYQWQNDYDSSIVLACEGENLPHSLFVNESFDDGSPLPGKELIERNDIKGATQLLSTLHGINRVKLLLQLGGYFLFKPGSDKIDMGNAQAYLTQALSLSDSLGDPKWKNASRSMLGKFYFQAYDFQKSKSFFSEVVNALEKSGDEKGLSVALAERSNYTLFTDTQKLADITKAFELFKKQDDKVSEIEALSKIAEIHFVFGHFQESENELQAAINIENEIGFKHIHYYFDVLAYIELYKGNPNLGLSYVNKAIVNMDQTNDRAFASMFYLREGDLCRMLGDDEQSIAWLKKTGDGYYNGSIPKLDWWVYFGVLASELADAGRPKEALDLIDSTINKFPNINPLPRLKLAMTKGYSYESLKQTSIAKKYFAESERIADQLSSQPQMHEDIASCYVNNGLFYARIGDMSKTKDCLKKTLALPRTPNQLWPQIYAAELQFKVDSSEGKYVESIREYQRYKELSDSFLTLRKARQIDEMNIQYGVAQKEKDLQLLQNKEALQQAELSKEKLTRNIIIIVSSLILLLFGLLYISYRLKLRSNKLLQDQQKIISQKNEALQHTVNEKDELIREKEWLVKEIHHRVKNNLQMVISLLNAQSEFLNNPSALNAIKESRERMQAIALLHQRLYQVENSNSINMRSYINELAVNIKDSMSDGKRINLQVNADDISLDMSQSVPLGLILNEAITNAIKYAYPKNESGIIRISLQRSDGEQLQLSIADHGRGLPSNLDAVNIRSLGLQLMKLFAEQLEGDLYFINKNGLEIILNFRASDYACKPTRRNITSA
jgi:two-component sensor histidine kinase